MKNDRNTKKVWPKIKHSSDTLSYNKTLKENSNRNLHLPRRQANTRHQAVNYVSSTYNLRSRQCASTYATQDHQTELKDQTRKRKRNTGPLSKKLPTKTKKSKSTLGKQNQDFKYVKTSSHKTHEKCTEKKKVLIKAKPKQARNRTKSPLLKTVGNEKTQCNRKEINKKEFNNIETNTNATIIEGRFLQSMETNVGDLVSNIICLGQNEMLIGRLAHGGIQKIKYDQDSKITVINEYPKSLVNFFDFCLDKEEGRILFSDRKNKSVTSLTPECKLEILKKFEALYPTCITISPDDFIFVGLVGAYVVDETCKDVELVKLDKKGNISIRINGFQNGHRIFLMPYRCSINPVNGDIVIADYRSRHGYIIGFSSTGKKRFSYGDARPGTLFSPRGLICSDNGNIICCNTLYGDIHILDINGALKERIEFNSNPIRGKPFSLALDFQGNLVVGTTEPNIQKPALLHIVDLHDML